MGIGRRGREDQNEQMDFGEFLSKAIIYWVLGKAVGLKGPASTACAFLGPIGENIFKFPLLESLGQALERQERQKKLDELKLTFKQDLESLFHVSTKNHSIESGELIFPKQIPVYSKWREVIKHPAIVLVLGSRGSGKSAVSYRVMEDFRHSLLPYVGQFFLTN